MGQLSALLHRGEGTGERAYTKYMWKRKSRLKSPKNMKLVSSRHT